MIVLRRNLIRKDINTLENIQRRATKLIEECRRLGYNDRLRTARLTTLETRMIRADMIEVFKAIKGYDKLDKDLLFTFNNRTSRGNNMKLYKKQVKLDVRTYCFSNRVVDEWNKLPDEVVLSSIKCTAVNINEESTRATT